MVRLNKKERESINSLVEFYESQRDVFNDFLEIFLLQVRKSELKDLIHSYKWRTKSPSSLQDKLERKFKDLKKKNKPINITNHNLFQKINDLAGFRILHLHTTQFEIINRNLLDLFQEENYKLKEGPKARVWDDESREYFKSINIKTVSSKNMYTSVHYIIDPQKKVKFTVEIQVRTLAEELWGEVDHKINYPHKSTNISCRDQIKVLARVTSSCTRLVDSIFNTHNSS